MAGKILPGDIIQLAEEGHFDLLIQGCNCFNTMGAGLARQLRTHWPQVLETDRRTEKGSYAKLGTVSWVEVPLKKDRKLLVVNAYTQYYYGRRRPPAPYLPLNVEDPYLPLNVEDPYPPFDAEAPNPDPRADQGKTSHHKQRPRHADYEAIRLCFGLIREQWPDCRIAYPMIGAGLAGGDWKIIYGIIKQELAGLNHTYVPYRKK